MYTLERNFCDVRCSALQCVAVWCSVLQCVTVCCSVLQCLTVCCSASRVKYSSACKLVSHCSVAVCCSVLQYGAVVTVCCSVFQCITVRSSILRVKYSSAHTLVIHCIRFMLNSLQCCSQNRLIGVLWIVHHVLKISPPPINLHICAGYNMHAEICKRDL